VALALTFALATAGCGRRRDLTYQDDVAPILARHCVRCHAADHGLGALPRLDRPPSAIRAAASIKRAVSQRTMPPWGVDNTGLCGTFRDALWLTDGEIATIVSWAEHGAPAGKPGTRPRAPGTNYIDERKAGTLPRVDATLDTAADYAPGVGNGAYRCFVADPGLERDRLLTAFRVESSDPRIVAQVTLFALDSRSADDEAGRLDEREPGPGYTCYGSARAEPARLIASWTWGSGVARMPAGTGLRLHAGRRVVVQIHYNVITAGLAAKSRTRIELQLDDGARDASLWKVAPASFELPAGQRYVEAVAEVATPTALTVYGLAPRMHTLGKTLEIDRISGTAARCLGTVEHWNVYWQQLFLMTSPLRLTTGERLRVTCTYDTQSRAQPVPSGERIADEACSAFLYVVADG
jgi:hypothetical protein